MISELLSDYPRRNRFYWREDGYAAKLNRAWNAAERFQAERDQARAELERERAKSAQLTREFDELKAQIALVRRAIRRPRKRD